MISADVPLKKIYTTIAVIGGAMAGSILVYAAVVEYFRRVNADFQGFFSSPPIEILRMLFCIIAFGEILLMGLIKRRILTATLPHRTDESRGETAWPLQRLVVSAVISYALCESIAIYGLILFLIGGYALDFYAFAGISVVGFAFYFPRYGDWEEWLRTAGRSHA